MLRNPQLLVVYLHDTVQKESSEMVHRVIEEGILDGSIHTDYPKQLAEVLMLLGDIWLNPMIYHCEPDETLKKLKFYQYLLKLLDLDIITDEMIGRIEEYANIYKANKSKAD